MIATDTEIAIRDAHGIEIATVTPCDGGAMVKIKDPSGAWRETMFVDDMMIGAVGAALVRISEWKTPVVTDIDGVTEP